MTGDDVELIEIFHHLLDLSDQRTNTSAETDVARREESRMNIDLKENTECIHQEICP